jgi:glutamate-ammonia-ligase adenylyltransferase
VGQRLIAYLMTMTGAGVAYAVDTRLRPSGGQGMLVASLDGFEHYQCERAQTWEHVAMLRARPIAGDLAGAQEALGRVRTRVLEGHGSPWNDLMEMRQRVETERSNVSNRKIPLKTGSGGLMDVDFLAGGGILERVPPRLPDLPSVPAMLRAAVSGPRVDELLEDYGLLRRVEAIARWMAGRAVEFVDAERLAATAELTHPGLGGDELRERLAAARERIRRSYRSVVESGTIGALESSGSTHSQS